MTFTDFLIIYLACGAPFGVYYFLQNRTQLNSTLLWFKATLYFIFWLPFRLFSLARNFSKKPKKNFSLNIHKEDFSAIEKKLEKILLTSHLKVSVYEFREVFERYAGLTIAANQSFAPSETEMELYSLAQNPNAELAAICLNRRNRKRLARHQTESRADFLNLISELFDSNVNRDELKYYSSKLVEFLKDDEAQRKLDSIISDSAQTASNRNVKFTEKDLWKPDKPEPSTARPISYQLPPIKPAMHLRKRD